MSSGSTTIVQNELRLSEGPIYLLRAEDRSRIQSDGTYKIPLAWPVFAWRVVVPKLSAVKGDPLQRAILRLCRAGVTRAREIAELISADLRLIERLIASFTDDGLLRDGGHLAVPGKELLAHDDVVFFDDAEADLGWIFRDAITGDVLPYFHHGSLLLDRAEETVDPLPFSAALSQAPSSLNVAEALRAYRRFVERNLRGEVSAEHDPDDSDPESFSLANAEQIRQLPQSIRIVSKNPERIALPIWFEVHSDDPSDWHMLTGFVEADLDYWVERRFEYAIRNYGQLRHIRDRWLTGAKEAFPSDPTIESEESKIDREMPFLALPQLEGTRRELARARRGEALFAADPENLDAVLSRYYKAVEAVTAAVINDLPDRRRTARYFTVGERTIQDDTARYAQQINVALPSRFLSPSYFGQAKKLDRKASWNPLVNALFLLFNAAITPDGKVRKCFSAEPNMLTLVDNVYEIRNSYSGHYSTNAPTNEQELVQSIRSAAERITNVLGTTYFA